MVAAPAPVRGVRAHRMLRLLPSQHATAHVSASGHPVVQSFEPGEDWFYDYRREDFMDGPRLAGSTGALPAPAGNTGPGSLPADFPLPTGTTLGRIAVRSTDITAPMEVPDGGQAAAFWKKELPAAGYKIRSAVVTKAIGEIKFSGNGCKSGSDIAISGEHVAFLCRR